MMNSLYIGATGMHAQQENVDTIANNLANVNTIGFKRARIGFSDIFYKTQASEANDAFQNIFQEQRGMGVVVSSVTKTFTEGELKQSDRPLDLAIRGNGFFAVQLPDGSTAFTRHGALQITKDGMLGTSDGYPLKQRIQIPAEALEIVVDVAGTVSARFQDENSLSELGLIELSTFANPEALSPIGDNFYVATELSGLEVEGKPGEDGVGTLAQGYLESSNVQLSEEMVNLVLAQRAYELNAKVIQAADEMLSISNNLRR